MKKIAVTILSTLACGAFILTGAAGFCALETPLDLTNNTTIVARADASQTSDSSLVRSTQPTQLLSPQSYEEYLRLNAPSDAAVTGNYTAIADGTTIYLFDRATNKYYEYSHEKKVTKLQFSTSETLYFLDEDMFLHTLDPQRLTAGNPTNLSQTLMLSCTTFLINGSDLYYTAEAGGKAKINKTTLSALTNNAIALVEGVTPGPTIAYYGDKLYYTSGRELWFYDAQYNDKKYVATFPHVSKISSMSIVNDVIFVCSETEENTTADAQNFFAYSLTDLAEKSNSDKAAALPTDEEGGYCALSTYDNKIYAVKNDSVREYSVADQAFTPYEICARSDSAHRIDSASELCLVGNTLFIADNGNERISVYDVETQTYLESISLSFQAAYLASDGATVLAANADLAIVYDLSQENYGQALATFNSFDAALVGVAGVYGKYYFATPDYRYAAQSTDGQWSLSAPQKANVSATLLTADAYGYLYVAGGGCVYKYTEEQFFADTQREKVCEDFPTGVEKMLVDYAGSVYALKQGKLQKIGGSTYALNTSLVYNPTATIQSFAFGIEDNVTYVLYQENYLATSTLLELPTVKKIEVADADKAIFAQESAIFQVVQTKPNTLLVRFDIEQLSGATLFPYTSYERRSQSLVALKIGEAGEYNVLAVYDEHAEEYFTCLALADFCEETDAYCKTYQEPQTGYLTNAVSLYKFPYLTDLLTVKTLPVGAQITLLGEVEKLDYSYYHIEYEDENGTKQTGYVPTAYITLFNGAPAKPQTIVATSESEGFMMLFRFAYITLGVGIVGALVDFLILRKPKQEDEDGQA